MFKRLVALTVASIALALAALFLSRIPTVQTGADAGPNGAPVQPGESLTPVAKPQTLSDDDYIAYRHVFAYIYSEEHGTGKPNQNANSAIEFFKHSVPLSEAKANVLAEIALETEKHTLAIEEQAATIIRRFRDRIDAEMKSGRKPSPEPPELKTLQTQRVRTTLLGRDKLRTAFRESTFSRFHKFLREGMNLSIEKAVPSPPGN